MNMPFIPVKTDNSAAAILDRVITGAFTLALVGIVGVMTFANFLTFA